jgi:hypothetical protein
MDDKRIEEWAQATIEGMWPLHRSTWPTVLASATRTLLSEAIAEYKEDAERYRWLREHKCNSLHLDRDGDHACNYTTAKKWIEEYCPDDFKDIPLAEIQAMKDANTIWRLQIYPNTPIGFNVWLAATLDSAIDAARKSESEHG